MTSDLSATALRDTVARVRKTLGDCDNHADLVCSSGDHHVDVGDLRALLAALARLQEERDAANDAWARVAKSLGVTAEAGVELAEEAHKLRAEVSRLTAALREARLIAYEQAARDCGMGRQWARERAVSYAEG